MPRLLAATGWLAMALSSAAIADTRLDAALNVSQGAIGSSVPDFTFQSADSGKIALRDLRGKPLLVTMVYTGCADVCPTIIESLAAAADTAEDALGKGSFNIITIGFDTRNDTPDRMRSFARAHGAGGKNWYFASSDTKTVNRLSDAVGFNFFPSAGGFDHMAQVTILDKNGKIYEQVYGSTFEPPTIVEPLKQLVFGNQRPAFSLAGLSDRVRLFCTIYDRKTGRYYFSYALPLSIFIGLGCLLGILAFLIREVRKTAKAKGR
ncbi:MAG: SCO family protein [Alphaproteobacteria bacterium]|nr:SCO family protein [Alphaproteobacteria bacterium]